MSKWSGFGALAAASGFALTWLCCLPFVAALGAGAVAAGSALSPLQPYLALLSLLLLGAAFVQTLRTRTCADDGTCKVKPSRGRWLFLGVVTLVTLLLITLPFWSPSLIHWSL